MIFVKLYGGLGNQLFQYALGRNLSEINNTRLKLDVSDLVNITPVGTGTKRDYRLKFFNITGDIATPEELRYFKDRPKNLRYFYSKLKPYYKRPVIVEKTFSFDDNILKVKDGSYLYGYWQSEKYFLYVQDILRHELTLKDGLSDNAKQIGDTILNSISVSLHIRRGDYLIKYYNDYHLLGINYYSKAISYIKNACKNVKVFVFSDDLDWARKNLENMTDIIFVCSNEDFEDLYLMSLCQHNIIANSSFSWWGAWLNKNEKKTVLYSRDWFRGNKNSIRDLIIEGWIPI